MARNAGKKQTKLYTSLLTRLTATLQSVKPLKAMGRDHLVDSVLAMETSKMNRALQKQVFSKAVLSAAQEEMYAIVMPLGMFIALVKYGMPFSTVMVLVVVIGRMLSQFGKVQKQYQKMAISESAFWSMKRTIKEAHQAEENLGKGTAPTLKQNIKLDHVDFTYAERKILNQLSLEIPAGSLTTLIGASGSGKTTVIDMVIGLLQPQSGTVSIDNQLASNLDGKKWRRMIGYVPQETLLLHDSIAHNVTLGDPELSDVDAEMALRDAGAWDFVQALPEGLASTVGERGSKLSGGQRQRIVIARALVNNPELLILDEATSALDPDSELEIRKTVENLRGKLTILAISHQTNMVEAADRVYRLENGQATLVN
jgi:ATP-binding cassette subfamily C protein